MPLPPDLTTRRFVAGLSIVFLLGLALRGLFPTADPPWEAPVGIVWHDEGPWVHNARNRALWGAWTTDAWNPMYLAPVFTGLEYVAFDWLGVGLWQARTVSMAMGLLSILVLSAGVAALSNRRAALAAAALLASNHAWVQWNRVALLESTMVAFIAISWGAYALAQKRSWWGAVAGLSAILSFFSKAAAAFYVAALGLESVIAILVAWRAAAAGSSDHANSVERLERRAAATAGTWTIAGLVVAGTAFLVLFVLPYWTEFRFYNWQMSVTRKPAYGVGALVDRASWVPVVNDFFTRMWPVTVLGLAAALALVVRWRTARPAERLLGLWLALGIAELVVHDAGNERRLIFLIPVLVVLAVLVLLDGRTAAAGEAAPARRRALVGAPLVLYASYIACAAIVRPVFAPDLRPSVRVGAVGAVILTACLFTWWRGTVGWLSSRSVPLRVAAAITVALVAIDLGQFWRWAGHRTYENVEASRLIGGWLPAGTLVQGKLANGLALENRIKPVFVGRGFGNYEDRFERDDVRYILTYVDPRLGYEGPVIRDVLESCPGWRILKTFDVAETASGRDRAALILKAPHCAAAPPRSPGAKN